MKTRIFVLAIALLAVAALACGTNSASTPEPPQPTAPPQPTSPPPPAGGGTDNGSANLTLFNNSGQDICFVHISLTASDTWGADWLDSMEIIADGVIHTFTVDPGTYDLQALDCSQNEIEVLWDVTISGDVTWAVGDGAVSSVGSSGGTVDSTLAVHNYLDVPICYVYIVPTSSTDWGDDWLGSGTILDPDASREFALPAGTYDLRAEDCNNEQLYQEEGIPISGTNTVMIGGGRGGAGDAPSGPSILLNNHSDLAVCFVYISLNNETTWGDDWLDSNEVIASGYSRTFYLAETNTYDILAEDCEHNALDYHMGVFINGPVTWDVGSPATPVPPPPATESGQSDTTLVVRLHNDTDQIIIHLCARG